ncbi:MAG: hypothetical protein NZM28_09515 [Fimbriimonadales bacterium]|nr:hypothetical protein [Fimbriimonadales bacterium]
MRRALSSVLAVALAAMTALHAQVIFSDDFESYTGQLPNNNPSNTNPFDLYNDPCDRNSPLYRQFNVWHGIPAWPNMQLVNTAVPYPHPDPFFIPLACLAQDPFVAQPDPIPAARSGVQMLWGLATVARTNYVNLDQRIGDGGYFEFWFYDDDTYGKPSRAWAEFRAYANLNAGLPATTLQSIPSLGPYDADSGVPPDNRALSNLRYNIRGDAISGAARPADANPRAWADFRQVARARGWRHAAIWLTGDGSAENPRRFTYVIDGITRTAPNPNRTMTTPTLIRFSDTRLNNVRNIYYDDVVVGIGTPKAFSEALFVGRILPECWRTDSNGYADVEGWIVDIQIFDQNDNLLVTLERRLPKKDPTYNNVDGTDDYTGLIGVPNLLPAGYSPNGTYKFRFTLRNRPFVPAVVTLQTPSRGQTITLACGDINLDGCVDDADLLAVLFAFGNTGNNLPEDANGDGVVDDADLLVVLFNFGNGC